MNIRTIISTILVSALGLVGAEVHSESVAEALAIDVDQHVKYKYNTETNQEKTKGKE